MHQPTPTLGPNTSAPASLLRPDCIVCGGEDREELLTAAVAVFGTEPEALHHYRCYEFWSVGDALLVLTAIGTAALEPLLWELLEPRVIRRIVLVGTAGLAPEKTLEIGAPYIVSEAYLAGTGLDGEQISQPLRPSWKADHNLVEASSVSTDFFYGFSPRLLSGQYPIVGGNLESRYRALAGEVHMIEMEVAPFYFLCRSFGGEIQYVAIKSPANVVGDLAAQSENSPAALVACMAAAHKLIADGG